MIEKRGGCVDTTCPVCGLSQANVVSWVDGSFITAGCSFGCDEDTRVAGVEYE